MLRSKTRKRSHSTAVSQHFQYLPALIGGFSHVDSARQADDFLTGVFCGSRKRRGIAKHYTKSCR
jgi:hypothetical protein